MSEDYPISKGIIRFLGSGIDSGDMGTGIAVILNFAKNLLGDELPPTVVHYAIQQQNALFGGYPTPWDVAPSIFFSVFFGVIMVFHLVIFAINFSRGHYFWLSLAWVFYCVMKVPAFALRVLWAKDNTLVGIALASSVLHIVPAYYLVSLNLILTQRLFTWRHPVGGSRWLFWNTMFGLYLLACVFIAIIVLCTFVPYLYYLRRLVFHQWAEPVQGTAVVIVLYVLVLVILIVLSYAYPPLTKDENLYTYQPWWIESFSPFYFVEKGAAQRAEATFMKRNHNHRHAIRVIAATHHHYQVVQGLSKERGSLKHNMSILMVVVSTVLILVEALLRCVVVFEFRPQVYGGTVSKPVMGYVTWGVFEGIVMVIYIVGRADLRFYRPDILPREVRNIITAFQTHYASEDEADDTRESTRVDVSEEVSKISEDSRMSDSESTYSGRNHPPYPTGDFDFAPHESDSLSFGLSFKTRRSSSDDSVFRF